jgi:hypothetical protein
LRPPPVDADAFCSAAGNFIALVFTVSLGLSFFEEEGSVQHEHHQRMAMFLPLPSALLCRPKYATAWFVVANTILALRYSIDGEATASVIISHSISNAVLCALIFYTREQWRSAVDACDASSAGIIDVLKQRTLFYQKTSHELRTPLFCIINTLAFMKEDNGATSAFCSFLFALLSLLSTLYSLLSALTRPHI